MKKAFLIAVLLILCGGEGLKAQTLNASSNGAITIDVKHACHVTVCKPNQPLHFGYNNRKRQRKHVIVTSNHDWQLLVRPRAKYLKNNRGRKIDFLDIEYTFQNVSGNGTFTYDNGAGYKLFQTPTILPSGSGSMCFDVQFELDLNLCKRKMRWGNYNVKVDFICISNCYQ